MAPAIRLLVGLGNPGAEYSTTRHNLGRLFVESLLKETKSEFTSSRQAEFFRLPVFFDTALDRPVCVARLKSFMNESGPALKRLMEKENVGPSEILVVVDDFSIPFGSLRLRESGSSGGHNGLKSIEETLQTKDYARLRLGVGPVPAGDDVVKFVLGPIPKKERERLPELFTVAREGLIRFFSDDLQSAQTILNKHHI